MKRKCDICGRLFKVTEFEALCDQYSRIDIRVQRCGYLIDQRGFNTCESCSRSILYHILDKMSQAPKKCFWCEHDFGPKHPNYRKGCGGCSNYSNFQFKKLMSPHQRQEWKLYFEEDNE